MLEIRGIDIRRMRLGPPKISTQKLADFVGVSRKTIINWEKDVGAPDIPQFLKICVYCKISAGLYLIAAAKRKTQDEIINLEKVREAKDHSGEEQ